MKDKILEIIKNNPKSYSRIIKNTPELKEWVDATSQYKSPIYGEMIYSAVHQETNLCKQGNARRFKSITEGYGFCGTASHCECAKQSVSKKVSEAKQHYSDDLKAEIQKKRVSTTIEKYGVSNVGQTVTAKAAHAKCYSDSDQVSIIVSRVKNTKLEKYGNPNYNNSEQIKKTFKEKYPVEYWCERYDNQNLKTLADITQLTELYQHHSVVELSEMLGVHIQTVYRYLNLHGLREPFKSSEELEIVKFFESHGITNIVRNTRKLLPSGREIDIYLPDFKIAIEYNGVYWHHEDVDHITRSYHNEKFKECEQLGIQLITIFSNFWKSKKEIVKQTLLNKLGIARDVLYARKCSIVEVKTSEVRDFLNANHIQGYTTSSFNYGLTHNNTLVALMTFGNTRIGIGKKEEGFELIRFASSCRVIGGASKLLKHFIKTHQPSKIISYSDNEWSTGKLYSTLGFTLEKEIVPSYWYLKPKEERLLHRFNFAKQKLLKLGYDQTLTEREITKQMGLLKIWDCGKRRWVLTLK